MVLAEHLVESELGHLSSHELAHLSWGLRDDDASSLQSRNLLLRTTLAAGDDCASVAHPAPGRGGQPSNEGHDRLAVWSRVVLRKVGRGLLLSVTTDLANHDDALGGRVVEEDFEAVDEVGAYRWWSEIKRDQVKNLAAHRECTRRAERCRCERSSSIDGDAAALASLTVERVTTDPDAKSLAKALSGGLAHSLVGEGARARDNALFW